MDMQVDDDRIKLTEELTEEEEELFTQIFEISGMKALAGYKLPVPESSDLTALVYTCLNKRRLEAMLKALNWVIDKEGTKADSELITRVLVALAEKCANYLRAETPSEAIPSTELCQALTGEQDIEVTRLFPASTFKAEELHTRCEAIYLSWSLWPKLKIALQEVAIFRQLVCLHLDMVDDSTTLLSELMAMVPEVDAFKQLFGKSTMTRNCFADAADLEAVLSALFLGKETSAELRSVHWKLAELCPKVIAWLVLKPTMTVACIEKLIHAFAPLEALQVVAIWKPVVAAMMATVDMWTQRRDAVCNALRVRVYHHKDQQSEEVVQLLEQTIAFLRVSAACTHEDIVEEVLGVSGNNKLVEGPWMCPMFTCEGICSGCRGHACGCRDYSGNMRQDLDYMKRNRSKKKPKPVQPRRSQREVDKSKKISSQDEPFTACLFEVFQGTKYKLQDGVDIELLIRLLLIAWLEEAAQEGSEERALDPKTTVDELSNEAVYKVIALVKRVFFDDQQFALPFQEPVTGIATFIKNRLNKVASLQLDALFKNVDGEQLELEMPNDRPVVLQPALAKLGLVAALLYEYIANGEILFMWDGVLHKAGLLHPNTAPGQWCKLQIKSCQCKCGNLATPVPGVMCFTEVPVGEPLQLKVGDISKCASCKEPVCSVCASEEKAVHYSLVSYVLQMLQTYANVEGKDLELNGHDAWQKVVSTIEQYLCVAGSNFWRQLEKYDDDFTNPPRGLQLQVVLVPKDGSKLLVREDGEHMFFSHKQNPATGAIPVTAVILHSREEDPILRLGDELPDTVPLTPEEPKCAECQELERFETTNTCRVCGAKGVVVAQVQRKETKLESWCNKGERRKKRKHSVTKGAAAESAPAKAEPSAVNVTITAEQNALWQQFLQQKQ
jgi:hypothetical protein